MTEPYMRGVCAQVAWGEGGGKEWPGPEGQEAGRMTRGKDI